MPPAPHDGGLRAFWPTGAASSGSVAQSAQSKINSIADLVRWLKGVPDSTRDAELTKVHAAAEVLQEESPTRTQVFPLCNPWDQPVKRDQKPLRVSEVTAELRERERE